jgi:hypothetical protein
MSERNFLYAMLNAVNKDQQTMQWQEISDSSTTTANAQIEENYYKTWDGILQSIAGSISKEAGNSSDPNQQAKLQSLQAKYQADSTEAQTQQNVCDGATQAAQQTVGQDGSNLQNQAQLASTLNSVASNMASLLGHAYS